ncbi:HAD family hydrolase [Alkaliphilus peptidifermentans]|uniref:phosphoserine phosphatase n=1 Tax=Alkaliphilus peptidifermentans DSM 18978 TaxID=1120976 RepID=A0A1G5GRP2_9FIRM|nr:HAD family phosphatase [Alkaliphilus peptidifermentans]SCY54206.1 phosphoserine phosphatase [Alkaliphilus peptidifermentans DSM 18978]
MEKYKAVCFDMDGTLITNTNSVEYLCLLNGREKEVREIEIREEQNEMTWIEADYVKAKLFTGLEIKRVEDEFQEYIKLIGNIEKTLEELRNNNIRSILVTAGPIQVAKVLGKMFKFDRIYGSSYEVKNGLLTGEILEHLGDSGKVDSLNKFCSENNIELEEVVAIGDSASDIKVFEKSGKSIAINYSDKLIGKADVYMQTNDLFDVIKHIIG